MVYSLPLHYNAPPPHTHITFCPSSVVNHIIFEEIYSNSCNLRNMITHKSICMISLIFGSVCLVTEENIFLPKREAFKGREAVRVMSHSWGHQPLPSTLRGPPSHLHQPFSYTDLLVLTATWASGLQISSG